MSIEVIDVKWFNTVGVILAKDDYCSGCYKAYIGVGLGLDEEEDKAHIAAWGSQFDLEAAKVLFPRYFNG